MQRYASGDRWRLGGQLNRDRAEKRHPSSDLLRYRGREDVIRILLDDPYGRNKVDLDALNDENLSTLGICKVGMEGAGRLCKVTHRDAGVQPDNKRVHEALPCQPEELHAHAHRDIVCRWCFGRVFAALTRFHAASLHARRGRVHGVVATLPVALDRVQGQRLD